MRDRGLEFKVGLLVVGAIAILAGFVFVLGNFSLGKGYRLYVDYAFSGNMLEGLQVLFQVNNLTNEPYIAYSENKQRLLDYQEYGTQYLLGLNYRF